MSGMLRFTQIEQAYPDVRPAQERALDFHEIYREFSAERAAEQASRCSQCGIPYCQIHCPLSNNIPDWLRLTAEGRLREAYDMASLTNTFPEICGRICPQDRLCEGNCVIERGFQAVTIGAVEKYITDTAWKEGWIQPFAPKRNRKESVGIIGAGPAGLAAAENLRKAGFQVHIYDRYDRVGGLMIYGIPNFKLEKTIVERRRDQYEKSGVHFHLDYAIQNAKGFDKIVASHDAVLIATGVYKARELQIPGLDLEGVFPALDFLIASNRVGLKDKVPAYESGALSAKDKDVVVIGGGDTAMDCVRTAVRQEARSVTCLYRRDRANMPGSRREVKNAEEEGVHFRWLSTPVRFHGRTDGPRVAAVEAAQMRLGIVDNSGRAQPEPVPGSEYIIKSDMVINALGFEPEELPSIFGRSDLLTRKNGTLHVGTNMMTGVDGVFAAGDIVRGASLVVWAIADGRDAGKAIEAYLNG